MKAVLLRVAIDTRNQGLGPILRNNSFEYIPISEDEESIETRRYSNTKGKCGKFYSDFVKKGYENEKIHFDPEFKTYTYGDFLKKGVLKYLEKGDYLIFYVGLKSYDSVRQKKLCIIGYFVVDKIFRYENLQNKKIIDLLKNNAHIKRFLKQRYMPKDVIIIKGSKKSKLLEKAIKIGSHRKRWFFASVKFNKLIGKEKDYPNGYHLSLSSPREIKGEYAKNLIKWLIKSKKCI